MDLALIVKITIVLLAGLSAAAAARRARASVRHVILATTFAAVVALPAVPSVLPALEIAVPPASAAISAVVPAVVPARAPAGVPDTATRPPASVTPPSSALASPWVAFSSVPPVPVALALIWVGGSLLLAGSLVRALFNLRRLRRTGIPWDSGQAALDTIARESGISKPIEVLRHDAIGAPVTWGVLRSVVLLPADAPQWDECELRQAFLHELEHIHRRDWIVQVVARAVCAVYWFHPLVWIAWRRLCLESERACDDAVLRRMDGAEYAQQLVSLAQRVSLASAVPMLSMAGRSDLSVRVRALLDTTISRGRAGRRTLLGASVLAAAIVLALSPLRAAQPTRVLTVNDVNTTSALMRVATLVDTATDGIEMSAESLQDTVVDTLRGRPGGRFSRERAEGFIASAGQGDIQQVESLLSAGMDVNTVVRGDGTPLIAAARSGQLGMVKLLIARGADVDLPVDGDGNPLIMAARAGRETIVRYLLDQGANANPVVEGDGTPLIAAAQNGDIDIARLLIARGADVNLAANGDGSPLIAAAGHGNLDIVELLLDHGADIEAIVPGDENALINAAASGHLAIVRLLVGRGANVNAGVWADSTYQVGRRYETVREYRSPLSMATKRGHRAVVDFLRANGAVD